MEETKENDVKTFKSTTSIALLIGSYSGDLPVKEDIENMEVVCKFIGIKDIRKVDSK
jgi:hypothetical protein